MPINGKFCLVNTFACNSCCRNETVVSTIISKTKLLSFHSCHANMVKSSLHNYNPEYMTNHQKDICPKFV